MRNYFRTHFCSFYLGLVLAKVALLIHRTKLENSNEFYEKHKDDILIFPTKLEREKLGTFVTKKVKFNKDNKIDIAISGLGFVTIFGTGYLEVKYFNNVKVIVRKAMI